MELKLKATVTIIAEYEVDTDDYGCKDHEILKHERIEHTLDPVPLLNRPGCQTFVKIEEV